MYRWLWLAMFVLLLFGGVRYAHADSFSFFCSSESVADQIGEALSHGTAEADEVAEPFLAIHECWYSNDPVFQYVVHQGSTFGTITVVGLSHKSGDFPELWGLMSSKEVNYQIGSI